MSFPCNFFHLRPWGESSFQCERTAEFRITTAIRGVGGVIEPDGYGEDVLSCMDHIGLLFTHRPDLKESLVPRLAWVVEAL